MKDADKMKTVAKTKMLYFEYLKEVNAKIMSLDVDDLDETGIGKSVMA